MMNWKDYLNYSKSLVNHIIKIFFLVEILFVICLGQTNNTSNNLNSKDSIYIPSKSPLTAVLLSAVIPGAGQIYNESYWKAPIVWGISGWLIYNWIINNDDYKSYRSLYLQTEENKYQRLRNFYRDQRDLFSIYLGLTYVLNLVDAYVDAELFDFSVSEDFFTRQPMINFRFKIR